MTPLRSRRASRLCTVVRDRPSARASSATGARAFSRSLASRCWSRSSMDRSAIELVEALRIPHHIAETPVESGARRAKSESVTKEAVMRKVAVIGAGKIGATVVDLLLASRGYAVKVIDQSAAALAALKGG